MIVNRFNHAFFFTHLGAKIVKRLKVLFLILLFLTGKSENFLK